MIALIAYPPSRDIMFPPAPLALVSSKGGVQKPKAGVLGSTDSATGAAENHKGEAVEAEASNFVNGIAHVALSSASGKHPQGEKGDEKGTPNDSVPDPTAIAIGASSARGSAGGDKTSAEHDKTKVPMETAMWTKMRPIMHGVADAADTWERFAKYTPIKSFQEFELCSDRVPQRAVPYATLSSRCLPAQTRRSGCPHPCAGHVCHVLHVHERLDLWRWIWLLWRSSHHTWYQMAQSNIPKLAEAARIEIVSICQDLWCLRTRL